MYGFAVFGEEHRVRHLDIVSHTGVILVLAGGVKLACRSLLARPSRYHIKFEYQFVVGPGEQFLLVDVDGENVMRPLIVSGIGNGCGGLPSISRRACFAPD
jgi:hypothetical protein